MNVHKFGIYTRWNLPQAEYVSFFKRFRFVPQSTNTHTGIGILPNGTEPEKNVHIVISTLWYDMEIQCKSF